MLRAVVSRTNLVRLANRQPAVGAALTIRALSSTDTASIAQDHDAKLRKDVKIMGSILGEAIKRQDPSVFEAVEKLRKLGREWRQDVKDEAAFNAMVESVKTYDAKTLFGVSRAFSSFLALANAAGNHQRVRRRKEKILLSKTKYGLHPEGDSSSGSIINLLHMGVKPEEIFDALKSQTVEIVLTAHPTEVNRRTMLRKFRRIKEILQMIDRPDNSLYDLKLLNDQLRSEIFSVWESDNLRRRKPTPVEEAKGGLAILENVLWHAVPTFLRKLDHAVVDLLHERLPPECAPIKVASWMGGDRDGNPNVTPAITLEVSLLSRWMAATLFKSEVVALRAALSMKTASAELIAATNNAREPYRELLRRMEARFQATIDSTNAELKGHSYSSDIAPYYHSQEVMDSFRLMYRSLEETGLIEIADGRLLDNIRRLAVFGLQLMPLDVRQESTRHSEALDAITKYLGMGSYLQWDEETRRTWLQHELASKRPLLPRGRPLSTLNFSPTVIDTLETFELAARLKDGSLGAYVISQCQQASDILAVMLLQQDAGVFPTMRVVPLFETLDDLQRSVATVDALFSMPVYRGRIHNKQEIMVGYSDSAKDAGRLAASWAQYNAQVGMMEVSKKHGVDLTFFHGKGGTVGRGGNPALFKAILAHPPHTINGRFRITEQGEIITQNFGEETVAERTLDLFTAGVLTEKFSPRPAVKPEWAEMMERLSEVSCDAYRSVVRGEPRFVPYFRAATPELELAGLNVGSRPAKRNPKGGVESLRAIPWVFAWTQTRLNLPTWLGVGESLSKMMKEKPETLKDMYQNWPWFRTVIDLLEMIMIKSDTKIAENYDKQLVSDADGIRLGGELRTKLTETANALLSVSGNPSLQADNQGLLTSLAVRNPYIDPLNLIQAELLCRLRAGEDTLPEDEKELLRDALLVTINGIANGMKNSG